MIKSHHILNLVHLIDSDDFIGPLQATHSYQIGGGGGGCQGGGLGGIECIKVTEQCLFHCNSQMSNIIAYACKYQLDIVTMFTGLLTPGNAYRTKDPKVTGPGTIYVINIVVTNLTSMVFKLRKYIN